MSKKKSDSPQTGSKEVSKADKSPAPKKAAKPKKRMTGVSWHPALRGFLSVLIILHLVAVFVAPWDLSTEAALPPGYLPPLDASGRPQPLAPNNPAFQEPVVTRALRKAFNHYLNLTYLNHGYQFFAPDPAGTHVIEYQVTKSDGTMVEGRFPDLTQQWPRLLYHRHMMLAEQSEMMGPGSVQQYSNHLIQKYGEHCKMQFQIHLLLSPEEVAAGAKIDDPKTYRVLGTFDSQANGGAEAIAIPGGAQ